MTLPQAIISVFMSVCVSSCVFQTEYPPNWSPVVVSPDNKCPDITGKYQDRGEMADNIYAPSLSSLLLGDSALIKDATYVSLAQDGGDRLDIAVWNKEKEVSFRSLQRTSDQFQCEGGLLKVPHKDCAMDMIAGCEWSTLGLTRSGEYLIIEKKGKAAGAAFVVPFVALSADWYRFPLVKE